ncbi:MAG: Flp pilus assembly complex ATPase component TadA [Pseudomonadota bacterium]|nr:Flp pilus assembly complex ATPase component TadA [Pseudomonadota bacterium]
MAVRFAVQEDETGTPRESRDTSQQGNTGSGSGGEGGISLPVRTEPDPPASRPSGSAWKIRPEMETTRIVFRGTLVTSPDGPLKVAPESRNLCALFDDGQWLVSASHRNSPLVTSVAAQARRQGMKIDEPRYVTPDLIQQAYFYGQKMASLVAFDENRIRRRIMELLSRGRDHGANDIHIEASGNRTKVEFRMDGVLRLVETWTQREGEMFLSAVWSHASTQSGVTANWLEPQAAMLAPASGADKIILPEGISGVRCQWMPLVDGGRYLDMRLQYENVHIMGAGNIEGDVDSLGFAPEQVATIRHLRSMPGGMIVVAAPTNAGKSTSLRVMLNRRMSETRYELNCIQIEDPPEGGVAGSRQIGVSAVHDDERRQEIFTSVMRSVLRLDPDIVMLGETRDLESATFLFRLAMTGRQVYTTLHVYAALAIPQRLRDLGIEPYLSYDHNLVRGMMSQRLIRKLCLHCRIPLSQALGDSVAMEQLGQRVRAATILMNLERRGRLHGETLVPEDLDSDLSEVHVANSAGCEHCQNGRQGRTVVAEVIETDPRLMELLQANHMGEARTYWLSPEGLSGMSMHWHAMDKVRKGIVAPDDAEIELGPLASEKEIRDVERKTGALGKWQTSI